MLDASHGPHRAPRPASAQTARDDRAWPRTSPVAIPLWPSDDGLATVMA